MAPWSPATILAHAAWLRPLFRPSLLQRHVAEASGDEGLSAAAVDRRRANPGVRPRSNAAHYVVYRAGSAIHRRAEGQTLLSVRSPLDAARAAVRLGEVPRQNQARAVWRRDCRDRLERRRDPRRTEEA